MFRRHAYHTLISIVLLSLIGSANAVEFELTDKSAKRPTPALTPADLDTYTGSVSVLDSLPDVPLSPANNTFASPLDPVPDRVVIGNGVTGNSMPESVLTTELPSASDGYAIDLPDSWEDSAGDFADSGSCGDDCACADCAVVPRVVAAAGNPGWYIDLWMSQGYTWNPDNPRNEFNTPLTFNDRANEYQLNQLYLTLGRRVRQSGGWDLGGRVDLLFGTDYFFTQSTGLETRIDGTPRWNSTGGPRANGASLYGLAVPQAYMEIFAPVLGGMNVKIGHFYTTIGYESVMAPENFFYSRAYTMQYGEPFTHTGILSSFGLSPTMRGHFGVTRGWDTWEDPNSKLGYLFGLSWTPSADASLAATVHLGREDLAGQQQRSLYSIVYTRQLNRKLRYVAQHDFGSEANAEFDRQFNRDSAKWYGLNQYLFLDINSRLTAGMRFEWFRDQDNARVLGIPFEALVSGGNYTELTYGLNWKATDHMTFRPELRWDWSDVNPPAGNGMFDDFSDRNQFTASMDMILQF